MVCSAPVVVGTPAGFPSFRDRDQMKTRDDKVLVLASLHDQAYVLCMLSQLPSSSFILHPDGSSRKGGAGRTARAGCYTGLSDLVTAASPPTQILRHNHTGAASDRVKRHRRT